LFQNNDMPAQIEDTYDKILLLTKDIAEFSKELGRFLYKKLHLSFLHFEAGKGVFVSALYKQRGKMARRFMHSGMAALAAFGVIIAPVIAEEFPGENVNPWDIPQTSNVLSLSTEDTNTQTLVSEKMRDTVLEYDVQEGDTVSSIAEKFGITEDTIRWQNNLASKNQIKVGQTLQILPVAGMSHKVQKGDTVYSIAKKYESSPQGIVDFPYNTFTNDETFELAVGQVVIVPDGIKPEEKVYWSSTTRYNQLTPDAGTVVASGSFVWPASGQISQRYAWYHKGIDIANRAAPNILAADSGKVVMAGWPDGYGYGNRVLIDHGNGYRTLYAHLSSIYVVPGQSVARGAAIGKMGSTGRSTGVHLHFEIIANGSYLNPLGVLQ
jgi:murein DD-endopeptidase MepM/ murein hydrolase activator NlpD